MKPGDIVLRTGVSIAGVEKGKTYIVDKNKNTHGNRTIRVKGLSSLFIAGNFRLVPKEGPAKNDIERAINLIVQVVRGDKS